MDGQRFAELSKRFAAAASRRGALRVLAGGAAAALLGVGGGREAAAGLPILNCKVAPQKCSKNKDCCTSRCRNGQCTCWDRGHRCYDLLEGLGCCSGRCHGGRCR